VPRPPSIALALAACVACGCGVERVIAVERIDVPSDAGLTAAEASADASADALADGSVASSCLDPAFVTSTPIGTNSIWPNGGYFVFNNVYNTTDAPGPQTISACSYQSWYVVSDQSSDAGAVESYPNVQMNFDEVPVSSLHVITSRFAETSPHVGVYEDAYDIWLNGVGEAGSTQILVWVDNFGRVPTGTKVTTATLGGRTYDVWKTSDDMHIVLVATVTFTSGTVDLLEIVDWTIAQGWLAATSTLGQIDFGVEIESTGGVSATYTFDDFAITTM
jgi:hypothetical protein